MGKLMLTIVLVTLTAALDADQTPRDLFERARMLEENNQKLADAIGLYEQAATGAAKGGQRELAATAYLRIGLLHERLGRKSDAERAFKIIVAQYADQTEIVRQAREKLPAAAAAPAGFGTRRVWADVTGSPLGSVSPDGRYLSFTDWNSGGELSLRDLTTGAVRHLTPGLTANGFAYGSIISPDSTTIAFNWTQADGSAFELQTVRIDASAAPTPQRLYRNDQLKYFQPFAWSPDGKSVLVLFSRLDGTNQLATISVPGGSAQVLKTLDWRAPVGMSFSPDGRFIIYDFPTREGAPERDVFLLSADGSRETRLINHAADDVVLGWAPDGRTVLFASDRTGSRSAWMIPVIDGKAAGGPQLVRADLGALLMPLGFTRAGAFYYYTASAVSDVHTATVDRSGRLVAPPQPIPARYVGANEAADWAPDGRTLAIVQQPPGLGSKRLIIRAPGGDERELPLQLSPVTWPRWSPDGSSILVSGRNAKNRRGIFRVDARSGAVTELLMQTPSVSFSPRADWAADGKSMFYTRSDEACTCVVRHDLLTGDEREIYRMPRHSRQVTVAASPDGRSLAVMSYDEKRQRPFLTVVPSGGGAAREVYADGSLAWFALLAWTPDSRSLIIGRNEAGKRRLWRVPAAGGDPIETDLAMEGLRDLRVSPDGQHVVFTAGANRGDIWVMEHFLPASATPARRR